ncbi:hypothetical protein Golomagni_05235 [Golovinomyces magnicellulatus]|nr:hypothetical protein Golomagni_05235 [Golovinomyces magnicellulatus]
MNIETTFRPSIANCLFQKQHQDWRGSDEYQSHDIRLAHHVVDHTRNEPIQAKHTLPHRFLSTLEISKIYYSDSSSFQPICSRLGHLACHAISGQSVTISDSRDTSSLESAPTFKAMNLQNSKLSCKERFLPSEPMYHDQLGSPFSFSPTMISSDRKIDHPVLPRPLTLTFSCSTLPSLSSNHFTTNNEMEISPTCQLPLKRKSQDSNPACK